MVNKEQLLLIAYLMPYYASRSSTKYVLNILATYCMDYMPWYACVWNMVIIVSLIIFKHSILKQVSF